MVSNSPSDRVLTLLAGVGEDSYGFEKAAADSRHIYRKQMLPT